ncbi:MAG: hypothetical protein HY606_00150 [Planctomycetes bacterium]|nr:hypothetical protein [Planctomycetota bacterium]
MKSYIKKLKDLKAPPEKIYLANAMLAINELTNISMQYFGLGKENKSPTPAEGMLMMMKSIDSKKSIDAAIKENPTFSDAYLMRAHWIFNSTYYSMVYQKQMDEKKLEDAFNKSMKDFDTVIAYNPNMVAAHFSASYICRLLEKYDLSMKYLESAKEVMPDDPLVYIQFGEVSALKGNKDAAENYIKQSEEAFSKNKKYNYLSNYVFSKACLEHKIGLIEKADTDFSKWLELIPKVDLEYGREIIKKVKSGEWFEFMTR